MNICCGGTNLVSHVAGCDWCALPESYTNGSKITKSDVNSAFGDCLRQNLPEQFAYGYGCVLPGVSAAKGRVGVKGWMVLGALAATVVIGSL